MTHVARIELTNWMRFRAAALDLGPRAYAVEAECDGDPGRSNWTGKSSLVEALAFALFGWHRFQEGARDPGFEDAWIAEGEREGRVAVVLSDGTRVERSRHRGQSTQIRVGADLGVLGGEHAETHLERVLCLSREDFFSTCFVRQRAASRLVLASPGDRMATVAAWLDLSKLEDAAEVAGKRLSAAVKDRDRLAARVAELRSRVRDLLDERHGGASFEEVPASDLIATSLGRLQAVKAELAEAEDRSSAWQAYRRDLDAVARRAADEADLAREEAALDATPEPPPPDPRLPDLKAAYRAACEREAIAHRLARGEFDGACPVRQGFTCPARAELNAGAAEALSALADAERDSLVARGAERDADAAEKMRSEAARQRQRQVNRVELLRSRLANSPKIDLRSPPPGSEPERGEVGRLRAVVIEAETDLAVLRRAASELAKMRADLADSEGKLAEQERLVADRRAARLVLGRGGAQRRVAEGAVGIVAEGANRRLARQGIALRVSLSWRREGAEPARSCEVCGRAFGRGRSEKACGDCGAPRGKAVQDRLDVSLSDRSGAAEDLAGLALQLSAAAMLRSRRGSPWSTLVLDEPFGALDERHREAASRLIAAEGEGRQALIVAHQPGVLEALPGRILIRGRGAESTVEVVE